MTLTLIPPPSLNLSTTGLNPSGTVFGPNPAAQTVTITNSGRWNAQLDGSKSQSWVTLSALSGTAPSNLVISFVTTGLAAGTYSDTVDRDGGRSAQLPAIHFGVPHLGGACHACRQLDIRYRNNIRKYGSGYVRGWASTAPSSAMSFPSPEMVNQALAFDGSSGYIYTAPNAIVSMRNT